MKKIPTLITVAMLASVSIIGSQSVLADTVNQPTPISEGVDVPIKEPISEEDEASQFVSINGTVSEIDEKDGIIKFFMNSMDENPAHFVVSDETLVLDAATGNILDPSTIKIDTKLEAYTDKDKPMIMIYPPQYSPDIVIVHTEEDGQVKVGKFDDENVSLDNQLKVNIAESTILVDEQGEEITEVDLEGKEWIVFYDASTKSIPAQTTPNKIVAFGEITDAVDWEEWIGDDFYTKEDEKMIPLRTVAEKLDYEVTWNPSTEKVRLSKQVSSYEVGIGAKDYAYNRSLGYLDIAPEIKEGRTYVPQQFIDLLLK